ncbi:sulfite reductase flavoprotein subunit alpha [Mycobacteroides chelonae]|uniref:assimilatory sulfite reductase (NADPH) n=1 Tax=Mycobacteroides chelonae TaxID=1774 RepID=A0AB73U1V5_MYCCH|nr:sulfite reductase flavoprotein subunit alpha [Mycobacteroides chelonae]MEC4840042.1 sulfite reductase flavoprotein subunit alpha [Mycobacteroides chelonae]MEC4843831.1 sulfite reductase flavoprotein subunit alpha [Mycobacteroides chelonae]OLT76164.1 sulfite reductase subunit alpha [Mycobacteroides chelonae]QDF70863.1 sulfite reductase flavoprotein subunit alpha [Mycobacteroides chelonae]WED93069.1 sulfite reductase flavoprotein subunit alpha [Mycobacteroides chelonae]
MTAQPDFSLIVGYGTDMGNAEDAAMSFSEALEEATGIKSEAIELNQIDVADLQSASHFVAVVSTFGDGEFTDNALLFWEAISAEAAGRLEHLSYAVLALGDSSYEFFCNAGLLLDQRLEALGAVKLTDRVDVDGPYLQPSKEWTTDLVKRLSAGQSDASTPAAVTETPIQPKRDRNEPVEARLLVNRLLTTTESDKEVRHYEVDLTGSGISYEAGDSIAVHASNDPALVAAILAELGVDGDHRVTGHDEPLGELLSDHLEIRTPSRTLRSLVATRTDDADAVAALCGDVVPAPGSWLYGKDVLDLIRLGELTVDELVDNLRPLQFRDYSIASSPLIHPDSVHLTVATIRYTDAERTYGGVASTFLADRGQTMRVHLRPNHTFRLPAADVPIIMVGPGTGIAPFRGFLQERQATGASGRSWLFFGDRRRATSFLYGEELQGFVDSGALTRLDLAFSRDGAEGEPKRYVQHCMSENAAELFAWLQDGAYLYVCGDADHMAKDVDATLHEIVARCGGMDAAGAHAYVNDLIKNHRYVRDVY